jgi:hypothetical protein
MCLGWCINRFDAGAIKFMEDLDMRRIPSQLIGPLLEAAPKETGNGTITVEIRDYRSDYLDLASSRREKVLMPGIRRIQLFSTPESR